jgi:hypothetical protein
MTKPIKPSEIDKTKVIPGPVIEAFNELIQKNYNNGSSVVLMDDALKLVSKKMNCTEENPLDIKWMDVEDIYRKAGWRVVFDQPAYNETYPTTYCFSRKSPKL